MDVKSKPERLPIFVYGTLLPGQPNAYLWGDGPVWERAAWLANGRLYDCGAFPMLVEEGEERVTGSLMVVPPEQYEDVLARLDDLEGYDPANPNGSAYQRVQREVADESGRVHTAWVYVGHTGALPGMTPIPGGDWRRYAATKFADMQQWWQDVSSVHGLLHPPNAQQPADNG